MKVKSC